MNCDVGPLFGILMALFGIAGVFGASKLRSAQRRREDAKYEAERFLRERAKRAKDSDDRREARRREADTKKAEIRGRAGSRLQNSAPTEEDFQRLRTRLRSLEEGDE